MTNDERNGAARGIRWYASSRDCDHTNGHVCPFCDFDRYYAANYDDCPWRPAAGVTGSPE